MTHIYCWETSDVDTEELLFTSFGFKKGVNQTETYDSKHDAREKF